MIRGWFYRLTMKIAHRFNWHYAPPIYPDGDTMLWCKWCGFRDVVKRRGDRDVLKPKFTVSGERLRASAAPEVRRRENDD